MPQLTKQTNIKFITLIFKQEREQCHNSNIQSKKPTKMHWSNIKQNG